MACRNCNSTLGVLLRRPAPSLGPTYAAPATQFTATTAFPSQRIHLRLQSSASNPEPPGRERVQDLRRQAASAASRRSPVAGVGAAYTVYGNTERLTRLVAAQADYTIDAADRKAGKVILTPDGEEVGRPLPLPHSITSAASTSSGKEGGSERAKSIWHGPFALPPTFSTWAHVSMLHLYLLVARLRALDDTAVYKQWQAQVVDHFFYEAERRIVEVHGITSGMLRQKYLKDLFVQWRGVILAYDEGVAKGDAVLAGAVWRNLFKGREEVDVMVLAGVVGFMRRALSEWDRLEDGKFLEVLHGMGGGVGEDTWAKWARQELAMVNMPAMAMRS